MAEAAILSDDQWRAHVARESAKAIGEWLAANGGMERRRIWDLTLTDLTHMADAAISRFVVLASERHASGSSLPNPLEQILLGPASSTAALFA